MGIPTTYPTLIPTNDLNTTTNVMNIDRSPVPLKDDDSVAFMLFVCVGVLLISISVLCFCIASLSKHFESKKTKIDLRMMSTSRQTPIQERQLSTQMKDKSPGKNEDT